MSYVTPGTVAAGDVATAAAWNILTNDVINLRALANVVGNTANVSVSTTSGSFITTGLTATITPTSNTSKVLINFSMPFTIATGNGATYIETKIFKNGVAIADSSQLLGRVNTSADKFFSATSVYLDSPATTSATTYAIFFLAGAASPVTVTVMNNSLTGHIVLQEIPA